MNRWLPDPSHRRSTRSRCLLDPPRVPPSLSSRDPHTHWRYIRPFLRCPNTTPRTRSRSAQRRRSTQPDPLCCMVGCLLRGRLLSGLLRCCLFCCHLLRVFRNLVLLFYQLSDVISTSPASKFSSLRCATSFYRNACYAALYSTRTWARRSTRRPTANPGLRISAMGVPGATRD